MVHLKGSAIFSLLYYVYSRSHTHTRMYNYMENE